MLEGRRMRHCFFRVLSLTHKAPGCSGFQAGVHYAGHVHGIEQICNRVQLEPPFWTIRQFMWGLNGRVSSISADIYSNRLDESCGGQARGRYRAPYQFSNEVVQEFRVSSNSYGAELGRSGGAVVNVVQNPVPIRFMEPTFTTCKTALSAHAIRS